MTEETFSDEMLMRFADGELDPATAARIEQAMETDDGLVARVAAFIETRAQAQAALKPLLDEPVPEKLVAAVERMIEAKRAGDKPGTASGIALRPQAAWQRAHRPVGCCRSRRRLRLSSTPRGAMTMPVVMVG